MDPGTIEANRRGELTDAQRAKLRSRFRNMHLTLPIFAGVIGALGYAGRASLATMWPFLAGLSIFLGLVYYFGVYRLAARGLADVAEGRVVATMGVPRVYRDWRSGTSLVHVDGKVLRLDGANAVGWQMLRSGARMRLHHLPRSLHVLTFEKLG